MAVKPYYTNDIAASVLAGLVLAVRTANAHQAINVDFCAGLLAMAQHQAVTFQVEWWPVYSSARAMLGTDLGALLDSALPSAVLQSGEQ